MPKKKSVKKPMKKDACVVDGKCRCDMALVKLSSMAFILFLVTVWPAVGNWLVGVPWWVYLIITVVLGAIAMKRFCCCK